MLRRNMKLIREMYLQDINLARIESRMMYSGGRSSGHLNESDNNFSDALKERTVAIYNETIVDYLGSKDDTY